MEHVFVHDDLLLGLRIDGRVVTTTEDHPFWNDTDKQWQRADALDRGDVVVSAEGARLHVGGLVAGSAQLDTAYNLAVDDLHTFFVVVGDDEVLVHNECLPALRDWTSQRFQFGNATSSSTSRVSLTS